MKNRVLISLIITILGCHSPNNSEVEIQWPNHAPVIEDIVVFPGTRGIPFSFDLICAASDLDGDSLIYTWSSMSGYYDSMDGNRAYWVAESLGTYSVSCEVSDGKATDNLSIDINVIKKIL
jgi:hypothetical protein